MPLVKTGGSQAPSARQAGVADELVIECHGTAMRAHCPLPGLSARVERSSNQLRLPLQRVQVLLGCLRGVVGAGE